MSDQPEPDRQVFAEIHVWAEAEVTKAADVKPHHHREGLKP